MRLSARLRPGPPRRLPAPELSPEWRARVPERSPDPSHSWDRTRPDVAARILLTTRPADRALDGWDGLPRAVPSAAAVRQPAAQPPAEEARPAAEPGRRCGGCGYLLTAPGHRIACGEDEAG